MYHSIRWITDRNSIHLTGCVSTCFLWEISLAARSPAPWYLQLYSFKSGCQGFSGPSMVTWEFYDSFYFDLVLWRMSLQFWWMLLLTLLVCFYKWHNFHNINSAKNMCRLCVFWCLLHVYSNCVTVFIV